jgi:hypothetical protein
LVFLLAQARFSFRGCDLRWARSGNYPSNRTGGEDSTLAEAEAPADWPTDKPWLSPGPDPLLGSFLAGQCPHEPAVLLTRACDDSYYGANGPCCKLDAVAS